ncbi:MAG: universal stress protein [Desulfobacterales bacterium]
MYKSILVPLDGSKRAETILPHVEGLALSGKGKVILLQVIEIEIPGGNGPFSELSRHRQEVERLTKEAADYLFKIKERFEKINIETITRIVYGAIAGAIITTADEEGADLIALTSHGKGGLSRVFYGSVSAGVLQRVDRPLLIIRSRRNVM